ncbi:hypothetical protein ACGFIY_21610 [Micromonospora chersina]|uniref:hypothetical protein n=1 Tax=Micromonospora chersina TaxID=47854 RepID=UPI003721E714
MDHSLPAVDSTWTRRRDGVTLTVTGVTTIHGKPNVEYDISSPDRTYRGVGISELDYFLTHNTEGPR